jgi:catechol 2,3-dioxygenase-like lactoylglutathione lyase family enzyme
MARLEYVIVFVDDVAQAVRFYRDWGDRISVSSPAKRA